MSKKKIWYNPDVEFIGAMGVNSVREMAELALAAGNEEIIDVLDFIEDNPSVETVAAHLEWRGVTAERIPTTYLRREQWEMANVYPCKFEDKPGRGFVKVLGVSL